MGRPMLLISVACSFSDGGGVARENLETLENPKHCKTNTQAKDGWRRSLLRPKRCVNFFFQKQNIFYISHGTHYEKRGARHPVANKLKGYEEVSSESVSHCWCQKVSCSSAVIRNNRQNHTFDTRTFKLMCSTNFFFYRTKQVLMHFNHHDRMLPIIYRLFIPLLFNYGICYFSRYHR